jgi:hypothetical protein
MVAGACGALVLRDQGPDRPAGYGKADPSLDPLYAMQFRAASLPQVRGGRPAQPPSRSDRDCPPDTARACCLWHAGGTAGENASLARAGNGSQLVGRIRPVPRVTDRLVGKSPKGSRQPVKRFNLHCPSPSYEARQPSVVRPAVHRMSGGHSCALLSFVRPPAADPAKTGRGTAGENDNARTWRRSQQPTEGTGHELGRQIRFTYHSRGNSFLARRRTISSTEAESPEALSS